MILNKQQIKEVIINAEKVSDFIKLIVSEGNALVSAANEAIMFQGKIENVEEDITVNETYIFDSTAINILKNSPMDEVIIERVDGKTKIRSGKYRATIEEPVYKELSFEQESPEKILLIQSFSKVKQVVHAAANEEVVPALKGINFKIDNGKLIVGATDGYRIASKYIDYKDAGANSPLGAIEDGYSFTIEKDVLNKAFSICGDNVCIGLTKTQVIFQSNNIAFLAKKMQVDFVNYLKILDSIKDTKSFKIEREALINATNRCNITKKDITAICMTVTNGLVTLSNSANENTVEVGEEIEIIGGTDVKINLNPKYILDALGNISDDTVEIQYTEELKPIKIEGDNYRMIVLPVANQK
ncbi:MAG: DNA polymerase III subunit beta [Clostridium sp.]